METTILDAILGLVVTEFLALRGGGSTRTGIRCFVLLSRSLSLPIAVTSCTWRQMERSEKVTLGFPCIYSDRCHPHWELPASKNSLLLTHLWTLFCRRSMLHFGFQQLAKCINEFSRLTEEAWSWALLSNTGLFFFTAAECKNALWEAGSSLLC